MTWRMCRLASQYRNTRVSMKKMTNKTENANESIVCL
jgi:hypothetical protein